MQQIALCIETDHLATRAEARVDAHDALLAEWGGEQQLAQILGKDADGLFVGTLLAECHELGLDRGLEQTLVAILDGLADQALAGTIATNVVALQTLDGLVVVDGDTETQDALALTATHGEQTVGGTALQRLLPIEVVGVFLGLVGVFLGLDNLRLDEGLATEGGAHLIARTLVFADLFGDDVLSAMEGFSGGGDTSAYKTKGDLLRMLFALQCEDGGQGLQALFASHLGTGATLGFIGQIDVF